MCVTSLHDCALTSDATVSWFAQLPILHSGGLELIFGNKKSHQVTLSASAVDAAAPAQIPIVDLLNYMKDNLLTERPELFLQNNTV